LKHSLIDQFVKFFILIGQSNASKYLQRDFDRTHSVRCVVGYNCK